MPQPMYWLAKKLRPTAATADPILVGQLRFTDNETVAAGDFALALDRVPPPPAGSHYALWLQSRGGDLLNLGELDVIDARVNVTGTTEQNLLAAYDTALISLEPDDETAGEAVAISAQIVFASTLPDALLPSVRLAFCPTTARTKGF